MPKNDEFLDTLRRANPIETVIGSYVQIKRQGRNYLCSCPFHSEKTPSCTVFPDTQTFYCFGCGAGGDVITFTMKIENLDFMETLKLLAQRSGIEMPVYSGNNQNSQRRTRIYEMNRLSANFFYSNLVKGNDKSGLAYFAERHITPQTIKKYGLGYAPDSWDTLVKFLESKGYSEEEIIDAWIGGRSQKTGNMFDMFRKRVIFPIIDMRKNVIGFGGRVLDDSKPKYLNTAKTPVFDKGYNLFSLNFAKNSDTKKIILCEGYMDVIALNQAGFENAVATLGTAITPEQARLISHYAEEVIIAYDSDSAGQKATQKAISHFSDVGLRTTVLRMEGAKDPDEFIKKFGRDRFNLLINNSADSINFMLDKCEQGLDLSTEAGKVELIKKASAVLAGIKNQTEREIYISRTSQKCGIQPDILKAHIDNILNKSKKSKSNKEWTDTKYNTIHKNDSINPEAVKYTKESKAEEQIISFLIKRPEEYREVRNIITPDSFVTAFNKKVYTAILERLDSNDNFSMSMLAGDFTPEEMGRISGMSAKYHNVDINMLVVSQCAEVLKETSSSLKNDDISIDDIAKKFQAKK
ncbi:MAG: DNA primase [Ruminococcus flavefaciens]|nr:DNA primase [Ruminococcus flavefaciens]